ncbi:hypothetical protein ANCCAN_06561 [Ancylostoma caninum]|uniref:Uncharacterized protein n=1 Tax=Ancylostoma caninum TaxID=29170 RepID=A0A368GWM0_ANCCA|nr:hypothetical protein ANCCAN_06561 [Ancylostoma caninum]
MITRGTQGEEHELHAFVDASIRSLAAAVYIRTVNMTLKLFFTGYKPVTRTVPLWKIVAKKPGTNCKNGKIMEFAQNIIT